MRNPIRVLKEGGPSRQTDTVRMLLVASAVLATTGLLVWFFADQSDFALLIALGVLVFAPILRQPITAYYIAIPMLFLLGNLRLSVPLPLLSSPADLIVSVGISLCALQVVIERRRLRRSPIYALIVFFVLIAVIQAWFTHAGAPVHVNAVQKLITGMWPFLLIVLALRTPRQARNVIISLLGTLLLCLFLWLPGFVQAALDNNLVALRASEVSSIGNTLIDLSLQGSLRSYLFIVPAAALVAIPMALSIFVPRYRALFLIAMTLVVVFTLASSIASGLVSLVASMLLLVALIVSIRLPRQERTYRGAMLLGTVVVFLTVFALSLSLLPISGFTLERILNPNNDISGSARLRWLGQAAEVFFASPLLGDVWGGTIWHGGHDSILTYAANWGAVFLLPYLAALGIAFVSFLRLAKRTARPLERALALGMAAALGGNIVGAMVTPNLIELLVDTINWTFVGLAVVWTNWSDVNPHERLLA